MTIAEDKQVIALAESTVKSDVILLSYTIFSAQKPTNKWLLSLRSHQQALSFNHLFIPVAIVVTSELK